MKIKLIAALVLTLATLGGVLHAQDTTINGVSSTLPNLKVNGNGGVLFNGTFGTGGIPATGNGTRMMWYPGKAALRAGATTLSAWEDSQIGSYSIGLGIDPLASGFGAIALNYGAAVGANSFAAGWGAYASGTDAVALSHSNAYGSGSLAAVGSTASGDYSIGLQGGLAAGYFSMAIGRYVQALAPFSVVIGQYNDPIGQPYVESPTDPMFVVGTGTDTTHRKNGFVVRRDGVVTIAKRQGDLGMGRFGNSGDQ